MTLDRPDVARFVNKNFVATYFNYDRPSFEAIPLSEVSGRLSACDAQGLRDGYGSGQVCFFICTADGRILHRLDGFVHADTLLREAEWSLELDRQQKQVADSASGREGIRQTIRSRELELASAVVRLQEIGRAGHDAGAADHLDALGYRYRKVAELSRHYLFARPEPFLLRVFSAGGATPPGY